MAATLPKLDLKTLIKLTPHITRKRGSQCLVKRRKFEDITDGIGTYTYVSAHVVCNQKRYLCQYKFYHRGRVQLNSNRPVWVHCSCPHFLYVLEVANTYKGCSSIITSNGAHPHIKNPPAIPGLCKHLFSASRLALDTKLISSLSREESKKRREQKSMERGIAPSRRRQEIGGGAPVASAGTYQDYTENMKAKVSRKLNDLLEKLF